MVFFIHVVFWAVCVCVCVAPDEKIFVDDYIHRDYYGVLGKAG